MPDKNVMLVKPLKMYTQEEYDNFPIVNGYKQCPTGDYSLITELGEHCSFAAGCRFGELGHFKGYCSFGSTRVHCF